MKSPSFQPNNLLLGLKLFYYKQLLILIFNYFSHNYIHISFQTMFSG